LTANENKKAKRRGKTVTGVNFYKKDMVVNELNQILAKKRIQEVGRNIWTKDQLRSSNVPSIRIKPSYRKNNTSYTGRTNTFRDSHYSSAESSPNTVRVGIRTNYRTILPNSQQN
jgi:hypothetical protein